MNVLDKLNPLHYMSDEKYVDLWQNLFANLLQGFWSRLFACLFLGLSVWFGIRMRNLPMGAFFFLLTAFVVYSAPIFKLAGFF